MMFTYMECSVLLYWYVSLQAKAGSIQLLNMSKPTDTQTLVPPSPGNTWLYRHPPPPFPLFYGKLHNNKIVTPAHGRSIKRYPNS